jgi:hypothetical protein
MAISGTKSNSAVVISFRSFGSILPYMERYLPYFGVFGLSPDKVRVYVQCYLIEVTTRTGQGRQITFGQDRKLRTPLLGEEYLICRLVS